ncbi:hypothetical protein NDN08_002900 [Rhodosorus marinus]|uniref:Derlin n=1 Tax=Rhodosorus marinus TaxID=101924 RepID=A0AAV8UYJ0_9RHOD|nr:hypothetical protein NDN08_002900 [Rhodosorus marinus]
MGSNFGANVGRTEPSLWDYVLRVPPVVRYYFAGSLLVTFLWHFRIIPSKPVLLDWESVFRNYNLPPVVLSFFHWGRITRDRLFELIFMVMTLFRQGTYLELSIFSGDASEYVFSLIFCGLIILVQDLFFPSYFLAKCLIMAILQIWVRHNPNQDVKVIFFTIRAFYLPLVMLGADFVFSGGRFPFITLKGLVAGHMYYFLTEILPRLPGYKHVLYAPQWFKGLFSQTPQSQQPTVGFFSGNQQGQPGRPAAAPPAAQVAHRWGSGSRLGS